METMEQLSHKIFEYFSDQIRPYFVNDTITFEIMKDESEVFFQNWMSIILVSNSDFRLTIKVYCKESDILDMGRRAFLGIEDKSEKAISDFVKELANLLGGTLKRALETSGVVSGLSLPLLVRAFDDLFFSKTPTSETFLAKYSSEGKDFMVQLYFEFMTSNSREKLLNLQITNPSVGSGEFEFL